MATLHTGIQGLLDCSDNIRIQPFKTRRNKDRIIAPRPHGEPAEEIPGVVCFTEGTAIRTPMGDVLIENLRVGDLVTTMDNGAQEIRWICRQVLDYAELLPKLCLRPVLIPKGTLGAARDMQVSRQHGMLVTRDTLAQAIHLCGTYPSVRTDVAARAVTYLHLMFDAHQITFAKSAPSESFYPRSSAMQMRGQGPRVEVLNLFPALRLKAANAQPDAACSALARKFLRCREVRSDLNRP